MKIPSFLKPLDFDVERENIINEYKKRLKEQKGIDYEPLISDDVNILISCILYRLGLKIDEINYIISNNYLEYSSGEYLDELVALIGIKRFKGSSPLAKAIIEAKSQTTLVKGTKFVSQDGATAYVLDDYQLNSGKNEIILIGDKEGEWQCNILEINNPLISQVTIKEPFTIYEKSESDDALRTRFINALSSFSTAGSASSYTHFSTISGVKKVKAINKEAGVVEIIYYGDNDGLETLIKQNLEGNTPLTDKVLIRKANIITLDLIVNLTLDIKANFALIQSQIINNIKTSFSNLNIGEAISNNKLISLCFVDSNVRDVEVVNMQDLGDDCIYQLNSIVVNKV